MTTLLVDRRDVELSLDGQRVLIREPEARPRTVPLAMLQRLVIQGRARLDTNLLAALGEHGVDVLLLGARHGRRRPPPDPVNACLSLGYTLLHNEALQAWPGSEEQAQ